MQVVTTSMVYVIMAVSQDGQAIFALKFVQSDSLDKTVLTDVTTHAKAVTIPMVCVILAVILAGRENTVIKIVTEGHLALLAKKFVDIAVTSTIVFI